MKIFKIFSIFLLLAIIFAVVLRLAYAAWQVDTAGTLSTNLISYWYLDETSGNRADSVGSNTLVNNNSVTSGTGKINEAADFEVSNSEFFEVADNASLSTGDIDFTISAWVQLESKATHRMIVTKANNNTDKIEYQLFYNEGQNIFRFNAFNSFGTSIGLVDADSLGAPANGTWYHIVAWHDSVANTLNIKVNNGTTDSA